MFDDQNADDEEPYPLSRALWPLLNCGRKREGVDLSPVTLTHHHMRDLGRQKGHLAGCDTGASRAPNTEAGAGHVQNGQK